MTMELIPWSNLFAHAEREVRRAGLLDSDSDYGGEVGRAALALVAVFASQGHSGSSAGHVADVFHRLSRWETLSPITNDPDEWDEVSDGMWQSKRNPALFSSDGGETHYHVDRGPEALVRSRDREAPSDA